MLSLLLMLAPIQTAPAPDHFCSGLARIDLKPGERLEPQEGPDFTVFYVTLADGTGFGVYDGNYAQVSGGQAEKAFERGTLMLNRMRMGGAFSGYLVTDTRGEQNHFFGSVFKGDQSDEAFFSRVTFGPCTP